MRTKFKYYLSNFEGFDPCPIYAFWIPFSNGSGGYSDVSADTLREKGHEIPMTPDFKTWKNLVLSKLRCGRCWMVTRGHQDLVRHNDLNHPGADVYLPD